jgi:hypothetical protein
MRENTGSTTDKDFSEYRRYGNHVRNLTVLVLSLLGLEK